MNVLHVAALRPFSSFSGPSWDDFNSIGQFSLDDVPYELIYHIITFALPTSIPPSPRILGATGQDCGTFLFATLRSLSRNFNTLLTDFHLTRPHSMLVGSVLHDRFFNSLRAIRHYDEKSAEKDSGIVKAFPLIPTAGVSEDLWYARYSFDLDANSNILSQFHELAQRLVMWDVYFRLCQDFRPLAIQSHHHHPSCFEHCRMPISRIIRKKEKDMKMRFDSHFHKVRGLFNVSRTILWFFALTCALLSVFDPDPSALMNSLLRGLEVDSTTVNALTRRVPTLVVPLLVARSQFVEKIRVLYCMTKCYAAEKWLLPLRSSRWGNEKDQAKRMLTRHLYDLISGWLRFTLEFLGRLFLGFTVAWLLLGVLDADDELRKSKRFVVTAFLLSVESLGTAGHLELLIGEIGRYQRCTLVIIVICLVSIYEWSLSPVSSLLFWMNVGFAVGHTFLCFTLRCFVSEPHIFTNALVGHVVFSWAGLLSLYTVHAKWGGVFLVLSALLEGS